MYSGNKKQFASPLKLIRAKITRPVTYSGVRYTPDQIFFADGIFKKLLWGNPHLIGSNIDWIARSKTDEDLTYATPPPDCVNPGGNAIVTIFTTGESRFAPTKLRPNGFMAIRLTEGAAVQLFHTAPQMGQNVF